MALRWSCNLFYLIEMEIENTGEKMGKGRSILDSPPMLHSYCLVLPPNQKMTSGTWTQCSHMSPDEGQAPKKEKEGREQAKYEVQL